MTTTADHSPAARSPKRQAGNRHASRHAEAANCTATAPSWAAQSGAVFSPAPILKSRRSTGGFCRRHRFASTTAKCRRKMPPLRGGSKPVVDASAAGAIAVRRRPHAGYPANRRPMRQRLGTVCSSARRRMPIAQSAAESASSPAASLSGADKGGPAFGGAGERHGGGERLAPQTAKPRTASSRGGHGRLTCSSAAISSIR